MVVDGGTVVDVGVEVVGVDVDVDVVVSGVVVVVDEEGTVVTVVVVELVVVVVEFSVDVVVVPSVVVVVVGWVVVVVVVPGSAQHLMTCEIDLWFSTEYSTPGVGSSNRKLSVAAFKIRSVHAVPVGGSPSVHVNVPSAMGSILSQIP